MLFKEAMGHVGSLMFGQFLPFDPKRNIYPRCGNTFGQDSTVWLDSIHMCDGFWPMVIEIAQRVEKVRQRSTLFIDSGLFSVNLRANERAFKHNKASMATQTNEHEKERSEARERKAKE